MFFNIKITHFHLFFHIFLCLKELLLSALYLFLLISIDMFISSVILQFLNNILNLNVNLLQFIMNNHEESK